MKKFVMAIVAAYIVLAVTNYLIHGVWLVPDYNAIPDSHRDFDGMRQRFWALGLEQLFFAVMFVYIYTRGIEKKSWVEQGIRYGIVITLLAVIPYSLSQYVVFIVPYTLAIKWIVAGAIQTILLGLVVSGIYREQPSLKR